MKFLSTLAAVISASALTLTACNAQEAQPVKDEATVSKKVEATKVKAIWMTDFEAAKKLAKKENKNIFIDFSGSDWCHWCVKLDEEVFHKPEFIKYASENLVLFMADFPRSKTQTAEVKQQNQALMQKYGVRGFPTIIILDSDANKVGRMSYQPGGAIKYVESIKSIVKPVKVESAWMTDFEAAKKLAKKENKHILIDFSGSDWCHWCVKLDEEVFHKPEFIKYASENLVLFMADFPVDTAQKPEVKQQNKALKAKYGVRGFPTVIILDPSANKVGKMGYQAGGPVKYIKSIKSIIAQ